jgi:hypothetical protein
MTAFQAYSRSRLTTTELTSPAATRTRSRHDETQGTNMSTRKAVEDWFSGEEPCSICGAAGWDGMWRGHDTIFVCRRCAIETLPALIADAVWFPAVSLMYAEHGLTQISAGYWRALVAEALRQHRRSNPAHDE